MTHKELMEHWLAGGATQRPDGETARLHEDGIVRYSEGGLSPSFGEWELLPPSPWIEWHATKNSVCPVPEETRGRVRLCDDTVSTDNNPIDIYDWSDKTAYTIVAYQVTKMPRPKAGRKVMITHESDYAIGPYSVGEDGISAWSWSTYEEFTITGKWRGWKYVAERRLMTREEALEFIIDNPTMLVRRNDSGPWCLPGAIIYPNDMFGFEYTLRDGSGERTEPRRFEVDA